MKDTHNTASAAKDYSLAGAAQHPGFGPKDWYATPLPPGQLRALMKRCDKTAWKDFTLWWGMIVASGGLLIASWGSLWAIPAAIAYGLFYGSASHSRWHECGHGTVFKSQRTNDFFFHVTSFMLLRNPYLWRWSHRRHHADTIVVGRDPEIAYPRPFSIVIWFLNLLYIPSQIAELGKMAALAAGRLTEAQKDFLPAVAQPKAIFTSRIHLALLLAVALLCVALQSWLPLMLVGLPSFYGSLLHHILATTQHAGLAEDVPDHRLNSRTVYLNPVFRFIYANMNYHVEHHMYPMVPFYALPALHEAIKSDCPPAYTSLWATYRELLTVALNQRADSNFFIARPLPAKS